MVQHRLTDEDRRMSEPSENKRSPPPTATRNPSALLVSWKEIGNLMKGDRDNGEGNGNWPPELSLTGRNKTASTNNEGEYTARSLPRVRLDSGAGGGGAAAGVRLRCWAAPPSITEEEAEDEPEDDASSLRAMPTHG
ncbi:hypothetical protein EVAR_22935_1 [Eumeta japonica]|uniref:Uncharacterized protein n=1 Tax=Eumeta variegata TaxID=151549 RepID=A0A4C1UU60_EUMVA|nr:hypothetical protein EVAR_22935_1 [Eumeta japonica]